MPKFPSHPADPAASPLLLPFSLTHLSLGSWSWIPQLAGMRRGCAAQDARLSLPKILRNDGHRSHTQSPRQPRLGSYWAAISTRLEMRAGD